MHRVWLCSVLVVGLVLLSAGRAHADPEEAGERAVVVWVGQLPDLTRATGLLRELLDQQGVSTRVVRQREFDADQVLSATRGDDAAWVFIVLRGGRAELYFRDPSGERFLLRELELPNGLDAVGRELLGQIVESSVVALLRTAAGVSRQQARAAIEQRTTSLPPRPAPLATAASFSPPPTAASPEPARSTTFEGWVAARYAARVVGNEFGIGHAPGVEVGVGVRDRWVVRVRGCYERWLVQRLETEPIGADLETQSGSLALDLGWIGSHRYLLTSSLIAGIDVTRIRPTRADADVTPEGQATNFVPVSGIAVRYEYGGDRIRAVVGLQAEVLYPDTHYDLVRLGSVERLAEPWSVRPGVVLAIGWAPRHDAGHR